MLQMSVCSGKDKKYFLNPINVFA